MCETRHYWQGGRKIEIERAPASTTVQAASRDEVVEAALRAGLEVEGPRRVAENLYRVELPRERDAAMDALRRSHVVHHVYHTRGQPSDEVLVTDSFFLKFKNGTPPDEIASYLVAERLVVEQDLGEGRLLVRVTDETGMNPIRAANAAHEREIVEYAEPNVVRELTRFDFFPADPLFADQWHLHAPAAATDLVPGAGVFAPAAWDLTKGVREVVVAVADDGFDLTHPDFQGAGKVAGRLNARPQGSGLVFDEDVSPRPGDYHGTPCAGVAVAEHNGQGAVGVAPGCALLAVRFPLSISDAQLVLLFQRISGAADVVSCSWGYPPADAPMSSALREVVSELATTGGRRGQGLVFCVAAGNNNAPVRDLENRRPYEYVVGGVRRVHSGPIDRWLAAHPDVITVAACTSLKKRAVYSSWGREVSVCAPSNNFDDLGRFTPRGLGIWTTDNEDHGPGSDFTDGSRYTGRFGGTSSATPTVAGICALVLSRNPSLTAAQVRRIVETTADKDLDLASESPVNEAGDFQEGFSLWFGHGKANAGSAVFAASSVGAGDAQIDYASQVELPIPDGGVAVESEIAVPDHGAITDLRVAISIRHTFVGDLRVDLIAPDGAAVTLHNHGGGGQDDILRVYTTADVPALLSLLGREVHGRWRLRVADTWFWDHGSLRAWRLAARVSAGTPQPDLARRAAATAPLEARKRTGSRARRGDSQPA